MTNEKAEEPTVCGLSYIDEANESSHALLLPGFTSLREGVGDDPAREAMANGKE